MTIMNLITKSVEQQSWRESNWMGSDWVIVPEDLMALAMGNAGHCNITVTDGVVTQIIPLPKPAPPPQQPTEIDRLNSKVDYIAMVTGVDVNELV